MDIRNQKSKYHFRLGQPIKYLIDDKKIPVVVVRLNRETATIRLPNYRHQRVEYKFLKPS